MDLVIVGHLFIRRLRDNYFPPRPAHRHPRGQDISFCHTDKAQQYSHKLGLQHHINSVYTSSNSINLISDLHRSLSLIHHIKPDILLLDIGSNDIANVHKVDPNLMLELAHELFQFAVSTQVPLVIINAVLPRTSKISSNPDDFRNNASHFNKSIQVYASDTQNVKYNKMRGFSFYYDQHKNERQKPVDHWSTDGIHCDSQSIHQYRNRIRHAVLDNIHFIKQGRKSS